MEITQKHQHKSQNWFSGTSSPNNRITQIFEKNTKKNLKIELRKFVLLEKKKKEGFGRKEKMMEEKRSEFYSSKMETKKDKGKNGKFVGN